MILKYKLKYLIRKKGHGYAENIWKEKCNIFSAAQKKYSVFNKEQIWLLWILSKIMSDARCILLE